MKREMCRGDTILISIDAPVEYPVTTLQEAYVSIKQGENEKLIPLSSFQLVTIPETGRQELPVLCFNRWRQGRVRCVPLVHGIAGKQEPAAVSGHS